MHLSHRTEEVVEEVLRELWVQVLRPLWREKKAQAAPRIHRAAATAGVGVGAGVISAATAIGEEHTGTSCGSGGGVSELVLESVVREGGRSGMDSGGGVGGTGGRRGKSCVRTAITVR